MERWWVDGERGKPEHSGWAGGGISHCHFFHHKSHRDWSGIQPLSSRYDADENINLTHPLNSAGLKPLTAGQNCFLKCDDFVRSVETQM